MDGLIYWIWLSRVFPYGSQKPILLVRQFGSPQAVFEAGESELLSCEGIGQKDVDALRHTLLDRASMILKSCNELGILPVTFADSLYPERFRNIFAPPAVFYLKGNLAGVDSDAAIGVVGTRNASNYGKRLTGNLCYELSKAGAVIVSGCAEGIDTFAHWGALKAGAKTIAVLGCGLDVNYPAKNRDLKKAILKKGALISECPPGEHPTRTIFPVRNRLISALSVGVMVTEAPVKSGALITAEQALEQGKDLYCVPPHDIYDVNFGGVSPYLRDGAVPVFSARDVLEEYFTLYPHKLNANMQFAQRVRKTAVPKRSTVRTETSAGTQKNEGAPLDKKQKQWDNTLSERHKKLYDAITGTPAHINLIAERTGLAISEAISMATELELSDYIESASGMRYARKGGSDHE